MEWDALVAHVGWQEASSAIAIGTCSTVALSRRSRLGFVLVAHRISHPDHEVFQPASRGRGTWAAWPAGPLVAGSFGRLALVEQRFVQSLTRSQSDVVVLDRVWIDPASLTRSRARSTILTGSPMSST